MKTPVATPVATPVTAAEIDAIRRRAERLRAEAMADMLARLGAWLRRRPLRTRSA
jgi:hypothetical protein